MTPPETAAGFLSPSLALPATTEVPAFELKFLIDEATAGRVTDWARERLTADPHGDPDLGGAYRTTSLYSDTDERDVFHRSPGYARRKFRVRRYGTAPWAYLERKSKSGARVAKLRTTVPVEELAFLDRQFGALSWPGHWFHRRVLARRLRPACRITYERSAYAGAGTDGPVRPTMDRAVYGRPATTWGVAPVADGRPLISGRVILELKFQSSMPVLFKGLVADLRLDPGPVSKYRLCCAAWGWDVAEQRGEQRCLIG